jgi:hypothetical protein
MTESANLEDLLEEINDSPELTLFFKRLFEDQRYGTLFLLHRDQLLVGVPKPAPYLYWNNLALDKAERGLQILTTIAQLESIRKDQASKDFEGLFGTGLSEMYDIIAFFAVKYAQQNEPIRRLVDSPDLKFTDLKKALGESKPFNTSAVPVEDPVLKEKAERIGRYFEQTFTNSGSDVIPTLNDLNPDQFMRFHLQGYSNQLTVGANSKLDGRAYSTLIDDLHSQQAIGSLSTYFWCESCTDIHQIYRTCSDIAPSHLNMTCLRCEKPMLVSAIYELDATISDSILSKDGILSVAVAWLLSREQVKFESNHYGKSEYDFVCDVPAGKLLIECKMHRTDMNDRGFRGALEQDLSQVSRQLAQLRAKEASVGAILVYNYAFDQFHNIANELLARHPNIQLVDFRALPSVAQRMKPQ